MIVITPQGAPDGPLEEVVKWLRDRTKEPAVVFGRVLRQSIDEVLDGPRTGRWDFGQLEKTEKTYVGTKIEIVLRTALGLERGPQMDLQIAGHAVDIKWAMGSTWQIPREAVGELCLCRGGLKGMAVFQVGVVRCLPEHLNPGENRDGKKTLSTAGREAMQMLVEPRPIPSNFVADMDPSIRAAVMAEPTIQARVTRLFRSLPGIPIPRHGVATVARTPTGDPMRRVRADTHAGDPLEGMKILSSKYGKWAVEALGYPPLGPNEFMAVPLAELERLPAAVRKTLGL